MTGFQAYPQLIIPPKPQAEFTVYPKWLHCSNRPSELADDEDMETAILTRWKADAKPDAYSPPEILNVPQALIPDATPNEKSELIAFAASKGIKIDKRWAVAKIKEHLAQAIP